MINLVDWAQADALLYFMVGIMLLLVIVIAVSMFMLAKKSKKK
jgi:hypothetical protein